MSFGPYNDTVPAAVTFYQVTKILTEQPTPLIDRRLSTEPSRPLSGMAVAPFEMVDADPNLLILLFLLGVCLVYTLILAADVWFDTTETAEKEKLSER